MYWLQALEKFLAWCAEHPWWSLLPAFLVSILLVARIGVLVHETLKKGKAAYEQVTQHPQRLRIGALVVVLATILALMAHIVGKQFDQAAEGPEIAAVQSPLLSKEFVLQWKPEPPPVQYDVHITDKQSGKTETRSTINPYTRITQRGDLEISVDSVLPDKTRKIGKKINVEVYDDSVQRIQRKKELVVAVHADDDDGLFCYPNDKKNGYQGFDTDLMERIAEALGRKYNMTLRIRPVPLPWPQVVFEPKTFKVDLAIASITINAARARDVAFSASYWETKLALVQRAGAPSTPVQPQEFEHLKVAVHVGTTARTFLDELRRLLSGVPQPSEAQENAELFSKLSNSEVEGVLYDLDRTAWEKRLHPDWVVREIDYSGLAKIGMNWEPERYGMTFALLNTQLRDDVDSVLPSPNEIRSLMENRIRHTQRAGLLMPVPLAPGGRSAP
jgi:ABC-type amino acid transport substrate-binding protein